MPTLLRGTTMTLFTPDDTALLPQLGTIADLVPAS